jgi:hypothetical protein
MDPKAVLGYQVGGIVSSFHHSVYEQYPFDSIGQNDLTQGIYGSPSVSYCSIVTSKKL